ncbi:TetR/AcrR family transcriptional regulator [Nonomuraea fuscirosea]|uniref:TetR/AcrR family transcriptional regulator n=1 Tax=Nonomuraea fuscirosea TaxID=1291556 RepID=UPI002DD99FD3|nr:helix-turn-helix domain-containing protein [Nonomuraea fuscirosea]WSA55715.1 TetR/AcrR family transcriptional regulator [Nonomuraea fuscirosea]
MTEQRKRRRYSSALRQEHAQATRQKIATAAHELMIGKGYAATTMADVAREAGVAVQTLYTSCPGGKPALAKLVYDVTLAGDARPLPQSDRPEVRAIIDEPDPVRKLARYAAMATAILRRVTSVHRVLRDAAAASPGDHGLRDVLDGIERERLTGSHGPAAHLHELGALRPGLSPARAAEQIYVLTATENFEKLTEVCRWSEAEYEEWLATMLASALLARPDGERAPGH